MDFICSRIFSTIRDESDEGTKASDGVETFTAEEIFHARRRKPNPRLSRGVPKGIKCELVSAGWPNWLVAAAGNALNGWLPRRADTFEFVDLIGQGAYSNAYKARDTVLNKVVALKKVRLDNLDPESVMFMAREIIILRRVGDHPSVIKLALKMYLVFDCMEYDLKGIQEHKGVKFSEPDIKCYMNQLLKGLNHCHRRGILHRDIKTSNLLVNKEVMELELIYGVLVVYLVNYLLASQLCLVELKLSNCIVFKLCGSPSDDFWQKSKFPTAQIFKPIEPYRRNFEATFHDVPAAAVRLMDTLLSIEAEYRGTAALALKSEFFTTEPFACDTSSLPQCPPAERSMHNFMQKRQKSGGEGTESMYAIG
ncbi:hypothetical protein KY290_030832 [Solanum tuberosum]|uniref:Protein kinase domain-containing protein n=1 Tax=Solanum tuberosum TaxID=4113 RepID=A0ABQ7U7E3_SOLTU|nr:hypothetical protein KY290_030832 [Solanum tuberosum]